MRCARFVFTIFNVLVWLPAQAQDRALAVAGDMGMGGVAGRATTTIQSGIDVKEGNLSLGLFGRVRLVMQDDPESGVVRSRDWDEVTDYVHILRYLNYQRWFSSRAAGQIRLSFQAGEILGYTLGHGSLIRDYSNIADPDHPHPGVHMKLTGERWSLASMVDNFVNPSVVATRVTLKPWSKLEPLTVGASVVVDPRAPLRIRTGEDQLREIDPAFNLMADTEPMTLVGLDVEVALGSITQGKLAPYMDLNTSMHGLGVHLGLLGEVPVGKTQARLMGQAEYRATTSSYAPAYMGTFYDVERYQAGLSFSHPGQAGPGERATKLAGMVRGDFGGQGVLGQAGMVVGRLAQLKMGVSYQPGPDPVILWWRAAASPVPRLNLGALLVKRGLGGPYPAAAGLMAMAEGRYRLTDYLYSLVQYSRTWYLRSDTRYYGMFHTFNISIGATWSG